MENSDLKRIKESNDNFIHSLDKHSFAKELHAIREQETIKCGICGCSFSVDNWEDWASIKKTGACGGCNRDMEDYDAR